MRVLINDPLYAAHVRAEREATDGARWDEVWDGVYVIVPFPDILHQHLASHLTEPFFAVVEKSPECRVYAGINVSDREADWLENVRVPDVAVVLEGSAAQDCDTHYCGGPDFLVEILTPNDCAREKLPFYAKVGVRELLIVDRAPWALELYRLDAGRLELVGTSTPDRQDPLTSAVMPLTFRLIPGAERPQIEVARTDGAQTWRV